ncbi:hypothetical protein PPACK8108_LOCUS6163, partial [Phakopsora pachyrhizi]
LDIDVIATVAERTFLSPFFTFWIPVLAICQNSRPFFNVSLLLFAFVLLRSTVMFLSRAWLNRRWTRGEIDWSEQLVVVTGGSNGLGRVLVETLVLKHVAVIVLDVVPFSDQPSGEDGDVVFYQCDITDPKAVREVASKIRQEHGHPTILVNNAGVVRAKLIIDLEPEEVQRTFGVNTLSQFYLLKEFLPEMIKNNSGHIVTISSTLGESGVAQVSDYCASKAGTISLHQSLRQELNSKYNCHKVRTTLVCQGLMTTGMFKKIVPQNQFFFPSLSPHDIAKKILRSIDNEESEEIFVPLYTNYSWLMKVLPYFMIDLVHLASNSNQSMIHISSNTSHTDSYKDDKESKKKKL